MAASVAASVVWLTACALLARGAETSSASSAVVGFAAVLDSGFLIGTGAFDYATTCLRWIRIKFAPIKSLTY